MTSTSGRDGASRIVARRYRLESLLGRGSSGQVWEAEDLVGGVRVAVKLLTEDLGTETARIRQEVSALRLLRIPGVVELIDDGVDGSQHFLVMELVAGAPFPGGHRPRPWGEIEELTLRLFETLVRIHGAGVVHRDLKPENVLVCRDERPVILDFGLSLGGRFNERITMEGHILGTPAYLAPEQITGEVIDVRADLYAVGVMLYEALSGRLPHEARSWPALLTARLGRKPALLGEVAPGVPSRVAGVVDHLLERSADRRPRSAGEVLHLLCGRPDRRIAALTLPRLGDGSVIQRLLAAARQRRPARLVGAAGSGRTRLLQDLAERLQQEGHRVAWTRPSPDPLGSLEELAGPFEELAPLGLDEMLDRVALRLSNSLAAGLVLLVDDAERVDPPSASVLLRCRAAGAVIEAWRDEEGAGGPDHRTEGPGDVVLLRPFAPADLEPLFAGPERLFHLRSDAARVLHARAGGLAASVAAEVAAWIRSGIARHDGALLLIDRDGIDRLIGGLPLARDMPASPRVELPQRLAELLSWMRIVWPHSELALLHAVTGEPLWRVEAGLDELVSLGAVRRRPEGRFEPLLGSDADQRWSPEQRRQAHQRVAALLPPGADGRLFHLLAATDVTNPHEQDAIAAEARTAGARFAADGDLSRATAVLREGLSAIQRAPGGAANHEASLLALWVEVALAEGTAHALDRVLYGISRAKRGTDELAALEALVRAALASFTGGEYALEAASAVPAFDVPSLERRRQGVRVIAARRCSLEREEAILDEVDTWAAGTADPRAEGYLAAWLARLRYRQGRFEEAIALHARAAERMAWETERTQQTLSTASCLLEVFRHDEAAACAHEVLRRCASHRHPYFEARSEWLARAAAYRSSKPLRPDLELLEAVALVGVPTLEAFICLNEAAVAWRLGESVLAAGLARRTHLLCARASNEGGALLSVALASCCGAMNVDFDVIAKRACACDIPGIGVQVLGMLALAGRDVDASARGHLGALLQGVPPRYWGRRMDVLSVEESLAALGVEARDAEEAVARAKTDHRRS
jgi:eukaryotic-like serine/threonine-protein kinase